MFLILANNVFAIVPAATDKGSLSPVEKVSVQELSTLQTSELMTLVKEKRGLKALEASISGPSLSPVLTGLSQLKRHVSSVERVNNPKLTTLDDVSFYIASLSLLHEPTILSELHASVDVLTPLSHFDVVSSLTIDLRVASLTPLIKYSIWDSLIVDPRTDLASLAQFGAARSIFIDHRATILTPLASFGFESEEEAIEYVTLADADSSFTKPKLYLRDYRGTLRTQAFYDDNIFSSSNTPEGSFVLLNDLMGSATLQRGRSALMLTYTLRDGRYEASPDDNYTDDQFNIRFDQKFAKTQSISIDVNTQITHEARGTGVSEGGNVTGIDAPLESQQDKVVVSHDYGGDASALRLVNTLSYNSLEYADFPELTDQREYSELSFQNSSKYRIGARTKLSVGASVSEVDYRFDPVSVIGTQDSLDSKTRSVLAGFERDIGRSSLGRIGFGTIGRSFSDADRESSSSGYWDAEFVWSPRSYSTVSLGLRKNYLESRGIGDFIDSREHKVAWAHAWAKRLSTQLNLRYTDDDYIGSGRKDQRLDIGLRVSYKFNSRLSLVGGGRYHELQSEGTDLDFRRQVIFIESNIRL